MKRKGDRIVVRRKARLNRQERAFNRVLTLTYDAKVATGRSLALVASCSSSACRYAKYIIKGRWPEAEAKICQDADSAVYYARFVLGRRWRRAEPRIAKTPWYAGLYAETVLKKRWPAAEATIATSPVVSYHYARDVIKGRFVEAEAIIANSTYRQAYLKAFPEASEDWLVNGWIDWIDTGL